MATPPSTSNAKLHVTLLLGLILCTVAFVIEIRRALSGHYLAWVYVFEWPVFAAFGLYVWWRLVHRTDDESSGRPTTAAPTPAPAPESPAKPGTDDPELRAWQDYVERLERNEKGRQDEP